jgi:hypothetical protein
MPNLYQVSIIQSFSYPVEVVADSPDDAIDYIHDFPNKITAEHEYRATSDDSKWIPTLIEKNVELPLGQLELKLSTTQILSSKLNLDYQDVRSVMNDFSSIINRSRGWAYCAGFYEALLLDLVMGYAEPTEILSRMTKVVKQLNQEEEQPSTGQIS